MYQQEYPSEIIPKFLFLGSCQSALEEAVVRKVGITHIVDATSEQLSKSNAEKIGISHLSVDIVDTHDAQLLDHFDLIWNFIEHARETSSFATSARCGAKEGNEQGCAVGDISTSTAGVDGRREGGAEGGAVEQPCR